MKTAQTQQQFAPERKAVQPAVCCPVCGVFVDLDPAITQCSCGFKLEWRGRVLNWDRQADAFYEARYAGSGLRFSRDRLNRAGGRLLLHFLVYGFYEAILRFVPEGARILDVACGGGANLLSDHARVTGLELSLARLEAATSSYDQYVRADIRNVEFSPGGFDAIVSSFFWEHVPPEGKDQLLKRFHRWLRPGGKLIMVLDVASNNPLFRWARQEPQLFREGFIENDGHYGLETAGEALERFARHGFSVRLRHATNRSPLQHLPVFGWLKPYGPKYRWARVAASAGAWMSNHRVPYMLYTGGLQLFDESFGRLLPLDWSRLLLVVLERPAGQP